MISISYWSILEMFYLLVIINVSGCCILNGAQFAIFLHLDYFYLYFFYILLVYFLYKPCIEYKLSYGVTTLMLCCWMKKTCLNKIYFLTNSTRTRQSEGQRLVLRQKTHWTTCLRLDHATLHVESFLRGLSWELFRGQISLYQ